MWKLSNWMLTCKKMRKGIICNMLVCTGPYLPEPGARLQLSVVETMEWKCICQRTEYRNQDWI